jgi:hypothetical protein
LSLSSSTSSTCEEFFAALVACFFGGLFIIDGSYVIMAVGTSSTIFLAFLFF